MIPPSDLPIISNILFRLDIPLGRRGRTRCPIHRGDNHQAFSYDDKKGQWYCFRCGIGGDAIELVKKALDLDFKRALQWLGIEPSANLGTIVPSRKSSASNPKIAQQLKLQRILRDEFRTRNLIEKYGLKHLRLDPNSSIGWELLATAYSRPGLEAIQYQLDQLLEEIPREAYPRFRRAAA